MKKIIIFSLSTLIVIALGFLGYTFVTDYIQASGPSETDTPLVMVDSKLYTTTTSCPESAFTYIAEKQGFTLGEEKITKTIKSNEVPTKNLSTNFAIFKKADIYKSTNMPDQLYIKTTVNSEVRYYLFTITV